MRLTIKNSRHAVGRETTRGVAQPLLKSGRTLRVLVFGVAATLAAMDAHVARAASMGSAVTTEAATTGKGLSNEPIQPLPAVPALDGRKVALGKLLFYDRRLSRDQSMACATCHNLKLGGADNEARSRRPDGRLTPVNTPSIFNAALNFRLFWNGRVGSLDDHIRGSMEDSDTDWQTVLLRLTQDSAYGAAFSRTYPDGLTVAAIQDALVTFERSLITPNGRFDRYLRGDTNAISADEKEGYRLFKAYGCAACHQGVNAGGNMYQKVGVMGDYFEKRPDLTTADLGRYVITGRERDRHMFRVPGLRNVALTAPYLHDGRIKTLEDAVKGMSKFMLGRPIEPREVRLIVKFLHTLNGEYEGEPL